jgi:hypothetical protein
MLNAIDRKEVGQRDKKLLMAIEQNSAFTKVEGEGVALDSGCLSWSPCEPIITFKYVR